MLIIDEKTQVGSYRHRLDQPASPVALAGVDPGDNPLRAVAVPLYSEHLALRFELGEHALERNPVGDAGAVRKLLEREGNRYVEMTGDERPQRIQSLGFSGLRGSRRHESENFAVGKAASTRSRRSVAHHAAVPSSSVTSKSRRAGPRPLGVSRRSSTPVRKIPSARSRSWNSSASRGEG